MISKKIVVYDKNGNESFHNHAVDAKEAVRTGSYFAYNPLIKQEPAPIEQKKEKIGEDISFESDIEKKDPIEPNKVKEPENKEAPEKKRRRG